MAMSIERPKLEGNVAVGDDRQLGFAEFGDPQGRAIFWLHGTPGARRQIPIEARAYAERKHIRLIGVDRPGIGSSTPHEYPNVLAFADDLRTIADVLGIDQMAVIGLSGGGPYTLACAAAMPDRIVVAGVLGGVAPTVGEAAIGGGLMGFGAKVAPALPVIGLPLRLAAVGLVHLIRPIAPLAVQAYAMISPEGDRRLLQRPEFGAMFLDDLLNGSRKQLAAPFADVDGVRQGLGLPARRGQGPGVLVARRQGPHRSVRPWRARRGPTPRRRAVHPAWRKSPRWPWGGRGDPRPHHRGVGHPRPEALTATMPPAAVA